MSAFHRAASDYYAEVDRRAADYVIGGMAPREAYAAAQRDVKIIRSQKVGATNFRTLYEQYRAASERREEGDE